MEAQIIIVGGIPGTGKTTIANSLSKSINAPVFTKDILEAAVVRRGLATSKDLKGVGYELMAVLALNEFKQGRSSILDCIASTERVKMFWATLIHENTSYIECVCSDVSIHRELIKNRKRNIPNWYELEWNDVLKIKETYKPCSEERLVLDATECLQSNINKAIEYVRYQNI